MVICYRCHKYKALNDFYCSSDDPLAQVCGECKKKAYAEKKKVETIRELIEKSQPVDDLVDIEIGEVDSTIVYIGIGSNREKEEGNGKQE